MLRQIKVDEIILLTFSSFLLELVLLRILRTNDSRSNE
jgi:hypothetical protein